MVIKGQHKGSCGIGDSLYSDYTDGYTNLHTRDKKSKELHTHTHRYEENWGNSIRPVDCITINILLLIVYCHSIIYHHWGNWINGTGDLSVLLLTTAYKSTRISKSKQNYFSCKPMY